MHSDSIQKNGYTHVIYDAKKKSQLESLETSHSFYKWLDTRRSIREFSSNPVPRKVIENLIKSASKAPSGAHKQPWTFCAISNPELKSEIR
jgi:hypothetical protein